MKEFLNFCIDVLEIYDSILRKDVSILNKSFVAFKIGERVLKRYKGVLNFDVNI